MSLFQPRYTDKRTGNLMISSIWWIEFWESGVHIRESTGQRKKTLARIAEENRRKEVKRALLGLPSAPPASERIRSVKAILATYQENYPIAHRQKSVEVLSERVPHLLGHLDGCLLPDLNEARMLEYMRVRKREGGGDRAVNMEVGILARAMGSTWKVLWPRLRRLEENHDTGRALTPDEEQRLIAALMCSRSQMLGPIVRIALMTGMRRDEIRLLRWRQINFESKEITVEGSKTLAGKGRLIPFGGLVLAAEFESYAIWYTSRFGSLRPDWYLFPISSRTKPLDPSQPIGDFKKGWDAVRKAAGVSCRFHDLRHTVATKMAEAGVPEATMLAIMGHMSRRMLERYSHIRKAAKVEAMAAVEARSVVRTSNAGTVLVRPANGVLQESLQVGPLRRASIAVTH